MEDREGSLGINSERAKATNLALATAWGSATIICFWQRLKGPWRRESFTVGRRDGF
jgi:hypothetical protein